MEGLKHKFNYVIISVTTRNCILVYFLEPYTVYYVIGRSTVCVVTRLLAELLRNLGSILGRIKSLSFLQNIQPTSGAHPATI